MHDPMTVAFDIKYPWRKYPKGHKHWPDGYRETFITIWHVDPETDGSDDSCGWSYARVRRDDQKALCRELADWELKFPYYFTRPARAINAEYPSLLTIGPGDCAALVVAAWQTFAWRLYRENLSPRMVAAAIESAVTAHNNYQGTFVLDGGDRSPAAEQMYRAFLILLSGFETARRRWWQHPRWHLRHWRVQFHPAQAFKRWAFTRCAECGGRFKWGESGVGTWDGDGPRWFRSETLTHMRCRSHKAAVEQQAAD